MNALLPIVAVEVYGAPIDFLGLPGPAFLKRYVALRYRVPMRHLLEPADWGSARARFRLMHLLYTHAGMSKSGIGRMLRTDLKTVEYGLQRHAGLTSKEARMQYGQRAVAAVALDLCGPAGPAVLESYVALRYGVTPGVLVGKGQEPYVAHARQHLMALLSGHCGLSASAIGRRLRRDHSTVIHGIRRHYGASRDAARAGVPA